MCGFGSKRRAPTTFWSTAASVLSLMIALPWLLAEADEVAVAVAVALAVGADVGAEVGADVGVEADEKDVVGAEVGDSALPPAPAAVILTSAQFLWRVEARSWGPGGLHWGGFHCFITSRRACAGGGSEAAVSPDRQTARQGKAGEGDDEI